MTEEISFPSILGLLADEEHPFPASLLYRFSDLDPNQLQEFSQAWPDIPPRRKRTFLEDLLDLNDVDTLVSFEELARSLLTDQDPQVRLPSIRLLWDCEDSKLIPTLVDILNTDEDLGVRAAAATGLGKFIYLGEIEEISEELLDEVEEQLLAATRSAADVLIRRRALEALGFSSHPEVPPLIEAAYARKETDWKVSALFAMGVSCDKQWEKQILANLTHQDEDIRVEAVRAAGKIPLASARPMLLDLLEDEEDEDILNAIIWSLSEIGGEGVRDKLEELLDAEPDEELEEFLEEALENLDFTEGMSMFDLLDFDEDSIEGDE
jgi:HEAT repeat protein